jgi:hypothetical protein
MVKNIFVLVNDNYILVNKSYLLSFIIELTNSELGFLAKILRKLSAGTMQLDPITLRRSLLE